MSEQDILSRAKNMIKLLTPPIISQTANRLIKTFAIRREWQIAPEGWAAAEKDPSIKGWNVQSVLDGYKLKWPDFVASLQGPQPLGGGVKATLWEHNAVVSFAYAVTLASRHKSRLSMLDWGGGIGHYYQISRAVLPDVEIIYSCKDVPVLCEYGRKLFPEATFHDDDSFLNDRYDFVLVSSSLQYAIDWLTALRQICGVTIGWLFITRLPVVEHAASFVVVQRAYKYGYGTEYLGWIFNREEFLRCVTGAGMQLIREFVVGEKPNIYGAPEQCEYRGFLFRPAAPAASDQEEETA